MKRGQKNVEARPEAARRRKACSRIEARLRQRRDKIDKTEETSNFSSAMTRKIRSSERSSKSSMTSSSESEISPRFMTSKQHVELVNFESRKFLPVPRNRKLAQNVDKKIEDNSVRETPHELKEINKNHYQVIVKREEDEKKSTRDIKSLICDRIFESKIQVQNPRNEDFDGKPSKIINPMSFEEDDAMKKRRSRSVPCNPLFKIKCAKDKCPRNLFLDRKSLVGEKKMTEEIRTCRKNCLRGLRISRSGEVAVTSIEGPRKADTIVDLPNLRASASRRDETETISIPQNLQAKKLQREDSESSFPQENPKLIQYEDIESPSNPKDWRSFQEKDIESSSHQMNRQSLQQQNVESSSNLENRSLIQRKDVESSNPMHRQSLEETIIESSFLRQKITELQDEDTILQKKEDIESCLNPNSMLSVQQKDAESCTLKENNESLQNEDTETKNPLLKETTESSSDLKNRQSLKQARTELSANSKNTLSLQQEQIELSSLGGNGQQLQQTNIGSIDLPKDKSKNHENREKLENEEEIEYKEEKNYLHVSPHSINLKSEEEVPKVETVENVQDGANFVSQEGRNEDVFRLAASPERRNEPEKRCSPRKPPKKRAFKWETMLEKQHQLSSRSPENRNESSETPGKIQEGNKFDFWTEKEANCSKDCRCPSSQVKYFDERKLVAYRAIREELPKILMKRRYLDPTMNSGEKIEAIKTKNWKNNLRESANQCSSPERPRKLMSRNDSRLNQPFVENVARRWARRDCSILADSLQIGDSIFGEKSLKNIEDSAKRDVEENLRRQRNPPKKNEVSPNTTLSPQNLEESIGDQKNFGGSIFKRRKSTSPRRVTFRLPGRVIEESLVLDEKDNSQNKRNFEELITEKEEMGWSGKNYQSEKRSEKNCNNEEEQSSFVGDKLRKHDEITNSFVEERSRKLNSSNTMTVTRTRNLQNMRWPSPSCLAGVEQEDENETDDSEQDWETPIGQDVYCTQEVTYPRETRQAMKILMRAKENDSRWKHSDHCHKKIDRREVYRQKEDYPRAEQSPEENATPVSSYANALAKFQEGCYLDSNRSHYGTLSQRRVSRNPNVAGGK